MLKAVVGLPGSGKSVLMKKDKGWIVLDDMGDDRTCGSPAWDKNNQLVRHCLSRGYNVIVSDVGFCTDEKRAEFQERFPEVEWVFFDNNKQACIENVSRRWSAETRTHTLGEELKTIEKYSAVYRPINPSERCYLKPV